MDFISQYKAAGISNNNFILLHTNKMIEDPLIYSDLTSAHHSEYEFQQNPTTCHFSSWS